MKPTTYFAIVEPTKSGYSLYFPDLLGCATCGRTIEEILINGKEVLGLHLWGMEKDNDKIPEPTTPPFINEETEENSFVMPITVYMPLVRNELETKSVKKTLTIPYWLNEEAERAGINFSQVLQGALKEKLNINNF